MAVHYTNTLVTKPTMPLTMIFRYPANAKMAGHCGHYPVTARPSVVFDSFSGIRRQAAHREASYR